MCGGIAYFYIANSQLIYFGSVGGANAIGGADRYWSTSRQTCAFRYIDWNTDTAGAGIDQKICLGTIDSTGNQILTIAAALQRDAAFATFKRADYLIVWIALALQIIVQQQGSKANAYDPHGNNHVATNIGLVLLMLSVVQSGFPV